MEEIFMHTDRCGMGYPYQPIMMPPMMPINQSSIEQRLNEIEKRLSILEANQNIGNKVMSNYQMI